MKSDLVDLEVKVHHQTDLAVKVSADGNIQAAVWLPKSQIEIDWGTGGSMPVTITLPQRLAEAKGLV